MNEEIINEWITSVLLIIGASFMLIAGIGIIRMPDIFLRLQATAKGATMGASCLLLAVAVHFGQLGIVSRALAAVLFLFITTPIAAHVIARAAYLVGVPLWEKTVRDDLRGRYDLKTHAITGEDLNELNLQVRRAARSAPEESPDRPV